MYVPNQALCSSGSTRSLSGLDDSLRVHDLGKYFSGHFPIVPGKHNGRKTFPNFLCWEEGDCMRRESFSIFPFFTITQEVADVGFESVLSQIWGYHIEQGYVETEESLFQESFSS